MIVKTVTIHEDKINITDYQKNGEKYYRARITTFYDPETRTQKQKTFHGSSIEAVEEQIYQAYNAASVIPRYNNLSTTVEEALIEFVNRRYKGQTLKSNLGSCKHQLFPEIGDIRVQKLTQAEVQQVTDILDDDGYAANTINRTISILRVCMQEFVNRNQIPFNPCTDIRLPKSAPSQGIALTAAQLNSLLDELSNSEYYLFYNVLALMALRVGEIRGLSWDKIDFSAKTIRIDQQIPAISSTVKHRVKNNNPTTLHYEDDVFDLLLKAKEQQEKYIREAGDKWSNPDNLVFTMKNGGAVPYNHVRIDYKAAAEKIGIPELRMHDLRHTYASHLWEETHRLDLVSIILRHVNTATTRVYIHPTETTYEECLELRNKVAKKLFHPSEVAPQREQVNIGSGPAKVSSLLEAFLSDMVERNLSRQTVVLRKNILEHRVFKAFGDKCFDDVQASDVLAVYDKMREDNLSVGSVYGAYSTMQAYFKFAIKNGVATKNPVYDAGIIPHS